MNLADMRSLCAAEVGIDNSSGSLEQGYMDRWANEAVMDFLQKSRIVTNVRTVTLGAVSNYQLPATAMAVKNIQVSNGGIDRPLEKVSSEKLLDERKIPGSGITRLWAPEGDYVLFYPALTASEVVTFFEVLKPTRLASTTDDPSNATWGLIPEQFHHILMQFMFWKAASYAGAEDGGHRYRQVYLEEVQRVGRFEEQVEELAEALTREPR